LICCNDQPRVSNKHSEHRANSISHVLSRNVTVLSMKKIVNFKFVFGGRTNLLVTLARWGGGGGFLFIGVWGGGGGGIYAPEKKGGLF